MNEARLYTYSEFVKTRRPDETICGGFKSANAELRESLVKLQDYWQDHLRRSRLAIQKAAERAGVGKAVIYGAGNCSDIPLTYLTDRFDHLTLVDIESQGVTKAVEALPGNLQAKVNIHIEDLTDVISETAESFTLLLSRSKSPTDFAGKVLASLPNIQPKTPDFGDNYDFVCSNLLGSQLPAFVGAAFAIIGNSKYPHARFDEDSISRRALETKRPVLVNNFMCSFQQAHIDLLLKSTKKPAGVIYLADTFDQAYLRRSPTTKQPYFIDEQGRSVSLPKKIQILALNVATINRMETHTHLVEGQEWTWYRQPPTVTLTGKVFGIKSFTFVTK